MSDTESEYSRGKTQKKQGSKSKSLKKQEKQNKQIKGQVQKKPAKPAKTEKKQKPAKANEKQAKKKKESKPKEGQGQNGVKASVFEYMQKQNRPYNILNVFDNLHGKIKKPVLQAILNQLYQEKKLSCKQFGKNKVYFINQDNLNVSKLAVDQLSKRYNQLRAEELELSECYKKSLDDLKKLTAKKTINEIKQNIINIQKNMKELTLKKQKLMNMGSEKIDEKQVQRIQKEQIQLRKQLNKRRKLTKQCLSTWSQILQKKIGQVAELMGVQI